MLKINDFVLLQKLFAKIGELKGCRFDRNGFGQFLGSATVTYERPADAKMAINEYHGAFLDDKVLTVEYSMRQVTQKVIEPVARNAGGVRNAGPSRSGGGKTLNIRQRGPTSGKGGRVRQRN